MVVVFVEGLKLSLTDALKYLEPLNHQLFYAILKLTLGCFQAWLSPIFEDWNAESRCEAAAAAAVG